MSMTSIPSLYNNLVTILPKLDDPAVYIMALTPCCFKKWSKPIAVKGMAKATAAYLKS